MRSTKRAHVRSIKKQILYITASGERRRHFLVATILVLVHANRYDIAVRRVAKHKNSPSKQ